DGGSNNYQYQFVNFNDLIGLTSVVSYKSNGLGSWTFNYTPGSPLDTTSVQTPLGTITYRHFGYTNVAPGNVWKVGLLSQRDTGGLQSESFAWTPQQISSIPVIRGNGVRDPVTNAPLMSNRTITRDGNSYSTSYSGFDQYGNPTSISESGDRSRTISKS